MLVKTVDPPTTAQEHSAAGSADCRSREPAKLKPSVSPRDPRRPCARSVTSDWRSLHPAPGPADPAAHGTRRRRA